MNTASRLADYPAKVAQHLRIWHSQNSTLDCLHVVESLDAPSVRVNDWQKLSGL
jgi:hypothetical protein